MGGNFKMIFHTNKRSRRAKFPELFRKCKYLYYDIVRVENQDDNHQFFLGYFNKFPVVAALTIFIIKESP